MTVAVVEQAIKLASYRNYAERVDAIAAALSAAANERIRQLDEENQKFMREVAGLNERIARLEGERDEACREAVIAWSVCASIHREFGKGRDALYTTRQADFVKHETEARAVLLAPTPNTAGPQE